MGDGIARGRHYAGFALATALFGTFVTILDALVVNVALPAIRADLQADMGALQWVVDGYALTFAGFLLSAGAMSDRIGARRAYALGLLIFGLTSVMCGFAGSVDVLIAARLLQGVGAAVMMPASLSLIREAYNEPVRRARAIALWAVGGAVASAAGPIAGGALSLISWRMIFFINVPFSVLALGLLILVNPSVRRPVPFDIVGQVSVLLAMGTLTYAVIEIGAVGLADPRVWVALVIACAAAAVFLVSQARGRHPMVPMSVLASRTVLTASYSGFAFIGAFFGMIFLYSLYLQQVRGLSSLEVGLFFLPMTILAAVLNPLAARAAERFGPRVPICSGLCAMTGGLIALAAVPESTPTWVLSVLTFPVGLAGPLAMPATIALLISSVPAERSGIASGIFNASRQLGGALAVAAFGTLVVGQADDWTGMRICMAIAAVMALTATVASLFLTAVPRRRPAPSTAPVAMAPVD
ncbi:MFS transporter [Rhodococcus koreensis]